MSNQTETAVNPLFCQTVGLMRGQMEKVAMSLMLLSGCMLATIQIRGIIKGSFPMYGFSNLNVQLEPIEKKLAIAAGVFFLLGLINLFVSFSRTSWGRTKLTC